MVGMARFERATPASRTQCPTRLGHIPTSATNYITCLKMSIKKFKELCYGFLHDKLDVRELSKKRIRKVHQSVIIYDLKCENNHKFEGWFKDRAAFERQKGEKLIACPVCGSDDVEMMLSSIAIMGKDTKVPKKEKSKEISPMKALQNFHEYINKAFEDVGANFAEVAMKMHYGEEDKKNIKGTTTKSEEENLKEEGIQFLKIPLPKFDS